MNSYLTRQLLPLIWIIGFCSIALELEKPIWVKPKTTKGFSAYNAMPHLNVIAKRPHHMGTKANWEVRDYIFQEFEKLGLETELFVGLTKSRFRNNYFKAARTENIIAKIKGSGGGKAVLVAAHYDSVLDAPGAADDGYAVACMLEVARLLSGHQYKNDIIFLVTDGEEQGLLGAKAFTEQKDLSNIGLVLNYEARGNSGASISFEWSDGNAWLVHQLRAVGKRPVTNSLSYEVYKLLPNSTDFTHFKGSGLPGINHAFIDGFAFYHNPADSPEFININSIQHTGENMFRLVKHFADTDLSEVVTENASFFNLFGFLPIYPSAWNLPLLIFSISLAFITSFLIFKKEKLSVFSLAKGVLFLLLGVGMSGILAFGLSELLFLIYPQYQEFYVGQFYNHHWYLLTCIGIAMLSVWLFSYWFEKNGKIEAFKVTALLLLCVLSVVLYIYMPTATYFLLFPILALALSYFPQYFFKLKEPFGAGLLLFLSLIPIGIWIPTVMNLFLAFSLKGLVGVTVLTSILLLASLILFPELWIESRLVPVFGVLLFLGSFVVGHITSVPTKGNPLPSRLVYHYNAKTDKSYFSSRNRNINKGNKKYVEGAEPTEVYSPEKRKIRAKETEIKPPFKLPFHQVIDSTGSLVLQLVYPKESYQKKLQVKNAANISSFSVNGFQIFSSLDSEKAPLTVRLLGFSSDTLQLKIDKKEKLKPIHVQLSSYFNLLPIKDDLPADMVRADGYTEIIQWVEM